MIYRIVDCFFDYVFLRNVLKMLVYCIPGILLHQEIKFTDLLDNISNIFDPVELLQIF